MAPNRRLKQARELRGWSQAKVAEQIGTDATTVSRWERGLFLPTPHFRERLCTLFGSNAEELGLLEATRSSPQQPTLETLEKPDSVTSGEKGERPAQEEAPPSKLSLPENGDTFTYILQSASQEQQAYMLWEHAYVRALQNQRADAQQLGEASANVFEQAKHPKAALVRTWLQQQGFVPSSSATSSDPSQKTGRKTPPWYRLGGTGLFLLSLIVVSLLISGLAFRWPIPSSSNSSTHSSQSLEESEASPPPTHSVQAIQSTLSPQPTPSPLPIKDNTHIVSTSLPVVASPTVPPRPTPSPTALPSNITATISPPQLTPRTCNQDSGSYRCVLTLRLYTTTANTTFNWQVVSTGLPARFNSASGAIVAGQDIVVVVYIDTLSCSYGGNLTFKFGPPNATPTLTISTPWLC